MGILQFENVNCKDCCKCIGVCPVKSIEVKNHQAMVVERDCILCGNCTVVCPQNTKHDVNDTAKIKELLHSGGRVIASVAPSYTAYFDGCGFEAFTAALKKLGFSDAFETAEGAYLVKNEYNAMLAEKAGQTIVSSCCSTVNAYIRKHMPEAIPYLAPVLTPMQAHARVIRRNAPDASVVFIGPCISKKAECLEKASGVDYAIIFGDLFEWFRESNIELEQGPAGKTCRSRFFPETGGILKTMERIPGYHYIAVDGPENCISTLRDVVAGKLKGCFIEMSFCNVGCEGGPAFAKRANTLATSNVWIDESAAGIGAPEQNAPDFDTPCIDDITAAFHSEQVCYMEPTEKQIAAIFRKMGKEAAADELNCGMCGYSSCREKAKAVFLGRAESLSDKIITITPNAILAVDLDLKVQQINQAACAIFSLTPQDIIGQPVSLMLDEYDFVDMIANKKTQVEKFAYLAEYNVYLKQSFFYDAASGVIICIMKNMTREKQRQNQLMRHKTQVAGMADDIVEKQLRIVHEIASLLGESAADTKLAITELKEAVMLENEEQ